LSSKTRPIPRPCCLLERGVRVSGGSFDDDGPDPAALERLLASRKVFVLLHDPDLPESDRTQRDIGAKSATYSPFCETHDTILIEDDP
jgi:hypothetical protein